MLDCGSSFDGRLTADYIQLHTPHVDLANQQQAELINKTNFKLLTFPTEPQVVSTGLLLEVVIAYAAAALHALLH